MIKLLECPKAEVECVVIGEGRVKNGSLVEDVVFVAVEGEKADDVPAVIVDRAGGGRD